MMDGCWQTLPHARPSPAQCNYTSTLHLLSPTLTQKKEPQYKTSLSQTPNSNRTARKRQFRTNTPLLC